MLVRGVFRHHYVLKFKNVWLQLVYCYFPFNFCIIINNLSSILDTTEISCFQPWLMNACWYSKVRKFCNLTMSITYVDGVIIQDSLHIHLRQICLLKFSSKMMIMHIGSSLMHFTFWLKILSAIMSSFFLSSLLE